jgi:hypothetical protein
MTITTVTTATLTPQRFAALRPAWPDTIAVTGGVLLARIHPRNNRPHGGDQGQADAAQRTDQQPFVFAPHGHILPSPRGQFVAARRRASA